MKIAKSAYNGQNGGHSDLRREKLVYKLFFSFKSELGNANWCQNNDVFAKSEFFDYKVFNVLLENYRRPCYVDRKEINYLAHMSLALLTLTDR